MKDVSVWFRVDASQEIGVGHLMRCLTLADELARRGASVSFACADPADYVINAVARKGYGLLRLLSLEKDGSINQIKDATMLSALLPESPCKALVVVDHYSLGKCWEKAIGKHGAEVLVIDDLANREHDCGLLLDQNLGDGKEMAYKAKIGDSTPLLLGPRYALLRPEFVQKRQQRRQLSGEIRGVMVSYGGSDPTNETAKAIEALNLLGEPNLHCDVVVGDANANLEDIRAQIRKVGFLAQIHQQVDNISEIMAASDLALGSGGSTTWERCCLALPSIIVTVADNQDAGARAVADSGSSLHLGPASMVDAGQLADAIKELFAHPERLRFMGEAAAKLVDGLGTVRVADAVVSRFQVDDWPANSTCLTVRLASLADAGVLFSWRNDPVTRKASHDGKSLLFEKHEQWLQKVLSSKTQSLYIVERAGEPIGTMRFDEKACGGGVLSWTVAPTARGRGVGKRMVRLMVSRLPRPLYAEVRAANHVSSRIAKYAGFELLRVEDGVEHWKIGCSVDIC